VRHTKNTLDAAKRGKSILLLGIALVHAVDLHRHAKQAHWNVGGPCFTALHELFDRIATAADKDADLLAERLVALGGTADGRVATVANRSTFGEYPLDARQGDPRNNRRQALVPAGDVPLPVFQTEPLNERRSC
jgi:starvation-inducible DNA-binding protein